MMMLSSFSFLTVSHERAAAAVRIFERFRESLLDATGATKVDRRGAGVLLTSASNFAKIVGFRGQS
jgi:hypothetical protein